PGPRPTAGQDRPPPATAAPQKVQGREAAPSLPRPSRRDPNLHHSPGPPGTAGRLPPSVRPLHLTDPPAAGAAGSVPGPTPDAALGQQRRTPASPPPGCDRRPACPPAGAIPPSGCGGKAW